MRTPLTPKASLVGLVLLVVSTAHSANYYLTRIDVTRLPGSSAAVQIRAFTDPAAFVVLENTSDHAAHCRVDFSTGTVPVAFIDRNIPPQGRRIERSPVAGPAGVIDVGVDCRLMSG